MKYCNTCKFYEAFTKLEGYGKCHGGEVETYGKDICNKYEDNDFKVGDIVEITKNCEYKGKRAMILKRSFDSYYVSTDPDGGVAFIMRVEDFKRIPRLNKKLSPKIGGEI